MKRKLTFLVAIMALSLSTMAQKFCFVDTKYILENIPEYKAAQEELDKISVEWQKEIEEKFAAVDRMYKDYQKEEILLTEEMKNKRQAEIIAKEKEAKELQKKRFGF
ncbi:MAG: OmpH family outer membrane protein, partial [Flavobacteriales bacterium]|nr:OmpH family outer membrane protein [Flavobacteriales bacterium]